MNCSVREATPADIKLIAAYWSNSDDDYLRALGVDLNRLPSQQDFREMLMSQFETPYSEKKAYALIWEVDGEPSGHCNVNNIHFGSHAHLHFHLWQSKSRQKAIGTGLVRASLPLFFENLELQYLLCEPYAQNVAPNNTLSRLGFTYVKSYRTTPGSINFEQEVIQWSLDRKTYESQSQSTG